MHPVQDKGAEAWLGVYSMHGTHGPGSHRLCQDGSHRGCQGKAGHQRHAGGGRPLHPLSSGVCY